jgi:rod shape-determining protein MreC
MQRNLPKKLIYVLAIVIPFWLLFFNSPFWHSAKMFAMSAGTASVSFVRWPLDEAYKVMTYRRTWRENQKLTREVNALKSRVVGLDELAVENRRYAALLGLKSRSMFSSVAALVVARDPSAWNSSLMIDKGNYDGIRPGMPVVNALGVIGKVAEVAERKSKVILMTDPGFNIAVVNQRSRESGLLSGSLSGRCRLYYLPEEADIRVGDELVTSPISTAFPAGLLVGSVTDVYPGGEGESPRAIVEPVVEVAKVEEVLVIK